MQKPDDFSHCSSIQCLYDPLMYGLKSSNLYSSYWSPCHAGVCCECADCCVSAGSWWTVCFPTVWSSPWSACVRPLSSPSNMSYSGRPGSTPSTTSCRSRPPTSSSASHRWGGRREGPTQDGVSRRRIIADLHSDKNYFTNFWPWS